MSIWSSNFAKRDELLAYDCQAYRMSIWSSNFAKRDKLLAYDYQAYLKPVMPPFQLAVAACEEFVGTKAEYDAEVVRLEDLIIKESDEKKREYNVKEHSMHLEWQAEVILRFGTRISTVDAILMKASLPKKALFGHAAVEYKFTALSTLAERIINATNEENRRKKNEK